MNVPKVGSQLPCYLQDGLQEEKVSIMLTSNICPLSRIVPAMADKCKLVSGFLNKVLQLISEQNLFPYLNSEFNSMKRIVDVKSSNIEELFAFV